MKHTDEEDEVKKLNAEQWQLDLLKLNPSYTSWGPHEDYMWVNGEGWNSPITNESWDEFKKSWTLDEYNECVNFYFEVSRESKNCTCEDGYHSLARSVVDSFYSYNSPTGKGWNNEITEDEYQALIESGRVDKKDENGEKVFLTREEVNIQQNKHGCLGHDAINRFILIEARLKRLGLPLNCEICNGDSYVYVAEKSHVNLILWMLHPRKGASRGVEIKNITQEDLQSVFSFLREAAERNAQKFNKIPK